MFYAVISNPKPVVRFVPDGKNNTLYIECPTSVTEAALGEPPRSVYPIIIVTVRENPQISLEYTAVVSKIYGFIVS